MILKFCGGGEPVPEATSSGPELLVEFTTSPFGTFLHPMPPHSLHGFQLEVQVRFSVQSMIRMIYSQSVPAGFPLALKIICPVFRSHIIDLQKL